MNWEETKAFLAPCFPQAIRDEMELLLPGELREIRIRAGRPAVFCTGSRTAFLDWAPDVRQVETLAEALSEHSLYARGDETRQGYVTLRGGHRMGLCGRVTARGLKDIGSLCIRIAAQWPGCADNLLPYADNLLIIGPPGSGKTTLLRDLARQLGHGKQGKQVAVIDERGELTACVQGVPQLDVGDACDVLEGCSKPEAVAWLVRSMAPQMIITDELGGPEDAAALLDAMACGASVIASCHGTSLNEVANRPAMAALMARRAFHHYALLHPEGGGRIAALYDRNGSPVKP
ncbi:MAG: Flp pilus assembly complex ATPase component TadA [Clostridia bacterium]|nr:Flp pilus assembly complex ATPase component TadA [Clostridia bacterium]